MRSGKRLDKYLVERGFVSSRHKAKAVIMAGNVFVNGRVIDKAGFTVSEYDKVDLVIEGNRYVSRGGLKLEKALKDFRIDVDGKVCMDVGASTGGFTDCLLKHGALRVYAIDVGKGQLDWTLRNDERVVVLEKCNARYLTEEHVPEPVDIVTVDVSFISLKKILPVVANFVKPGGVIIALVKPQFELSKKEVDIWKGIIKDKRLREKAINSVVDFCKSCGIFAIDVALSEPRGPKGNREFFVLFSLDESSDLLMEDDIKSVVYGADD